MKKFCVLAAFVITALPLAHSEDVAPASAAPVAKKVTLSAEVKIGTGLENRDVTGEADSFPATTPQLVGWSRVTGAEEPTQVMHVWKLNGEKAAEVPLSVQTSSYRTHSRKTVEGHPGKWSLEVQDMDGNVLGSKEVTVTP